MIGKAFCPHTLGMNYAIEGSHANFSISVVLCIYTYYAYMLSILLWFMPPLFSTFVYLSGNCPYAICMHRKTLWRNSSPAFDPLTQKWEQLGIAFKAKF